MAVVHSSSITSKSTEHDIAQFGIQTAFEKAFVLKTVAGKKIQVEILDARLKEFLEQEAAIKAIEAYLAQQREVAAEQEEKQEEAVQALVEGVYQAKKSDDNDNNRVDLDKSFKAFIEELATFYHKLEEEQQEALPEEALPENTTINNNLKRLQDLLKDLPSGMSNSLGIPNEITAELTIQEPQSEKKQLSDKGRSESLPLSNPEDDSFLDKDLDENIVGILTSVEQIMLSLRQHYRSNQTYAEERRNKSERALGKTLLYQAKLDNYAAQYSQYSDASAQITTCRQQRELFFSHSRVLQTRTKDWDSIARATEAKQELFNEALARIEKVMDRHNAFPKPVYSPPLGSSAAALFKSGQQLKRNFVENDQYNTYKSPSPLHTKLRHTPNY